jgi:fumarate hydratase class I
VEAGETLLLLNGKLLTGRDAAHKRMVDMLAAASRCRSISPTASSTTSARSIRCATKWSGPAGPTTATRMDKFTRTDARADRPDRHGRQGRARPDAIEAIRDNQAVYLMAVGGAAYLVSKAIKARVVAFADLGMEAIYEFEVQDMPVTVAVDSQGESVHTTGPKEWQAPYARESDLRDAWLREFYYRRSDRADAYVLFSLGKDGAIGGDGEDADIGIEGSASAD